MPLCGYCQKQSVADEDGNCVLCGRPIDTPAPVKVVKARNPFGQIVDVRANRYERRHILKKEKR